MLIFKTIYRDRCNCSREISQISDKWIKAFEEVQAHGQSIKVQLKSIYTVRSLITYIQRKTFNVIAFSMLTVTSRFPNSLFIPGEPLLNRRGHTYAAKWLWNRLIGGPKYNLSKAILSQDAYYCPSLVRIYLLVKSCKKIILGMPLFSNNGQSKLL